MADKPRSGFFKLPLEIRIMIYKLLFEPQKWAIEVSTPGGQSGKLNYRKISVGLSWWPRSNEPDELYVNRNRTMRPEEHNRVWLGKPSDRLSAQFLRGCTAVNMEATSMLYEQNTFRLDLPTLDGQFLKAIGLQNAARIRRLDLARNKFGEDEATKTYPSLLRALPNLRSFDFLVAPSPLPAGSSGCRNQCYAPFPCNQHKSRLRILLIRFAKSVTESHRYLKWFVEYNWDGSNWPKCYKLSDRENTVSLSWYQEYYRSNADSRPYQSNLIQHVVDIEKRIGNVKLIRSRTGRHVQRLPLPISDRPTWKV